MSKYTLMYYFIILGIIILITVSNIYVKPLILIDGFGYRTVITIYFLKVLRVKIDIGPEGIKKTSRRREEGPTKKHGLAEIYKELKRLSELYYLAEIAIRYLVKKINIVEIRIKTAVGTDDAYHTAMMVGLACSIAGILVSVLTNAFNDCKKNICIIPDFSGNRFELSLACIFKVRTAYIIVAGIKFLSHLFLKEFKRMFYKAKAVK